MAKGAANNNQEETDAILRMLLEAGSETAAILGADGTYLELNSATAAQVRAHAHGDVLGRSLFEFIAPEDRVTAGAVRDLLRHGAAGCFEWVSVSDSGIRHRWESRLVPLPAQPGQERRFALFSRDMTPFRAVERSHELLASIVASSVDALIATDCEMLITAWNHGAELLYEITAEQVMGKPVGTYLAEESAAEVRRVIVETLAGQGPQQYEARRIRKDGTAIDLSVSLFAIYDGTGRLTGTATIQRDISGLKRTEAALLETQAQLRSRLEQQRAVAEFGQHALRATELAPLLAAAAPLLAATLGVEHSHVLELMPGDRLVMRGQFGWDPSLVNRSLMRTDENSQSAYTLACNETIIVEDFGAERRFGASEHRRRYGIVSGISTVIGGRGKPYGVLSAHSEKPHRFSADDSAFIQSMANLIAQAAERLAGEQVVRRSEEYYRSLIENSSDVVSVVAADGTVLFNSESAARMFGDDHPKPIGRELWSTLHPDDRESAASALATALETGAVTYECRVRRQSDGSWLICEVRGRRIVDPDGRTVAVFNSRDISERKAAERAILDTQTQLRSRLEQQRAVAEFGQHALRATELAPLLDRAVAVVARTLDVEYSHVFELEPDGKTMALRAASGATPEELAGLRLEVGENLGGGYALAHNEPVIITDYPNQTRFPRVANAVERSVQAGLSVAIGGRDRPYGVLGAHT
ncbi:MAG TPA: PAS domain S-box protein, partial [Candidatus Binataceae bacterium]|nr:PAS domain S-box protein [Candidatus Binataceae bacterium]